MNTFHNNFRSLRTREKSIHRQLYLAMLIQVVIRLIVYTDQLVSRHEQLRNTTNYNHDIPKAIDNTVIWDLLLRIEIVQKFVKIMICYYFGEKSAIEIFCGNHATFVSELFTAAAAPKKSRNPSLD